MSQTSLHFAPSSNPDWRPSPPPVLDGIDEIALDCETTGLRWWRGDLPVGLAVGYMQGGRPVTQYLPFAHKEGGNLDESVMKRWAQRELRGKKIKNLNSRFDNHMMYKWGIDLEEQDCVWGDIGHYAALLDDQRRHGFSLEKVAQDYIGEGKVQGLDAASISEYHAGDVHEYAEQDVALVLKVMEVMRPKLASFGLDRVVALEDQVIFAVCEMERNGSLLDRDLLWQWRKQANEEIQNELLALQKSLGFSVIMKGAGSRDSMVRVFRELNLEIKKWTSGGEWGEPQPSFADDVLAKIDHPDIARIRKIKRIQSIENKYLTPYWQETLASPYLLYALNQLKAEKGGTVSGRFSSSTHIKGNTYGDGVNIQQVMRPGRHKEVLGDDYNIREVFIPEDGLWFKSDARQIEFRLFVHYSNSERLIAEYARDPNVDFHNIVWEILKTFNEDLTRKNTKDVNFAEIYGAGVFKTSQMLKIPMRKAKEFVEIYNERFPEVKQLLSDTSAKADERGYVRSCLGRIFQFSDGQFLHKALSRVIQGSAADVMKKKLVELHKARKQTGFKMRFTVHDEVNGDVPDEEAGRRVAAILNKQTISFRVPILWDSGVGKNWADAA